MPTFVQILLACLLLLLNVVAHANDSAELFIAKAEQMQLAQDITWQRLMYADLNQNSEVSYAGYFYHADGRHELQAELIENIQQLLIRPRIINRFVVSFPHAVLL